MASIHVGSMDLYTIEVGKPLSGEEQPWEPGVYWNWTHGQHHLLIFWDKPSSEDIAGIKHGAIELGLLVQPQSIWLLHRAFQPVSQFRPIDWSCAPYSWHMLTEQMQSLGLPADPESVPQKMGDELWITLCETSRGIVKAIRRIALPHDFTCVLYRAIREQATRPKDLTAFSQEVEDLYDRFRDIEDMVHLAIAWTFFPSPLLPFRTEGKSIQHANFIHYKEGNLPTRQAWMKMVQPDYAEFSGLDLRYLLANVSTYTFKPSAVAMLQSLFQSGAEKTIPPGFLKKAIKTHQWFTFEHPLFTAYGPIGGLLLRTKLSPQEEAAMISSWPAAKRERYRRVIEPPSDYDWMVELCSPLGDGQVATLLDTQGDHLAWKKLEPIVEVCPVYQCAGNEPCATCQQMEQDFPRWLLLLEAMLLGFFQELIEVREETVTEKQLLPGKGGKKPQKREIVHRVKVIDVSRRKRMISPEERIELQKERHSWIAGKPILTEGEIDWLNPPSDDTVILAERPVTGYTREYTHPRYVNVKDTKQTIAAHKRPRQPILYGRYKRAKVDEFILKASAYEKEENGTN